MGWLGLVGVEGFWGGFVSGKAWFLDGLVVLVVSKLRNHIDS